MDIKLTSQGKEAHSSMHEKGYNAIDPLMDLLVKANKAFRETDKNNPDLGNLTFNTTVFNGGEQINMIPGEATAQINVWTIPEFNNSLVEKKLTEYAKQNQIQSFEKSSTVFKVTDWWTYENVLHIDVAYVLNEATREYIADLRRLDQHDQKSRK